MTGWGRGKQLGCYFPYLKHKGVEHQLFAVYTYGVVQTYFDFHSLRSPFDDLDKRKELMRRLNQIEGVDLPDKAIKEPNIPRLSSIAKKKSAVPWGSTNGLWKKSGNPNRKSLIGAQSNKVMGYVNLKGT